MGKAARTKQIRRIGRIWTTRNPWTGEPEQFRVFIADQGLAEWERDRVGLAKCGYPDYPPAVDTFVSRAWAEQRDLPWRRAVLGECGPIDDRAGLWVSDDDHWIVKGIVHARADGRYDVSVSYADKDGLGIYHTYHLGEPVALEDLPELEHTVAAVAELLDLPAPRWLAASDVMLSVTRAAA